MHKLKSILNLIKRTFLVFAFYKILKLLNKSNLISNPSKFIKN